MVSVDGVVEHDCTGVRVVEFEPYRTLLTRDTSASEVSEDTKDKEECERDGED